MGKKRPTQTYRDFEKRLHEASMVGLTTAGEAISKDIHRRLKAVITEDISGDSRTLRSVGYTLSGGTMHEADFPGDAIQAPEKPNSMIVGVGVPYALYIEIGSGPHSKTATLGTSDDPDGGTFMEKMYGFARRIGLNPDENRSDKARFEGLIKSIRENGTDAHPFMPQEADMKAIVKKEIAKAVKLLRLPINDVTIEVDMGRFKK